MTPDGPPNSSNLPTARPFLHRSLENVDGDAIRPTDSISMRKITKTSSSHSIQTKVSDSSSKCTAKGMDIESQSSARTQYDTRPATSSSNPTNGQKSAIWITKLHPSAQTIEDAVMGTSDGMTVPFALTASLAGFAPNARYVMLAGLAELTAGAISMALGGALQARCEQETYVSTAKATETTIRDTKDYIPTIVEDLFSQWNFSPETLAHISCDLSNTPIKAQTSFIVRFHHELSVPDNSRVLKSSATLGSSYFMAGFLGLLPYMIVERTQIRPALYASIAVEAVALYVFGYAKTGVSIGWTGRENLRKAFVGAVTMVLVGAVASGIAVGLITGVNKSEHVAG